MFGKINDKQDISDKNVPRLVPNFKFVAAPCRNEKSSEEALFLLINDSYNEKNKIKLEQYLNMYKDKLYTKYLVIVNKYCDDNNYDFSRDGLHVKDRTEPLYDLPTIPQNVDGKPWYDMDLFKDTNNSYELKNNNDIVNDYNRNRKSELF